MPSVAGPARGFRVLKGYFDPQQQRALRVEVLRIIELAPLFQPRMPRTGKPFSVLMTNCGPLGWVADSGGYRYQACHPETEKRWPDMPDSLTSLWRDLAGETGQPDACLVNLYRGKAKLGSHVDRDEETFEAPVISVSLGDDAVFHIGGRRRNDPKARFTLSSGDVVVLGGESRLAYHGIDKVLAGSSQLIPGGGRINLTLRRVRPF